MSNAEPQRLTSGDALSGPVPWVPEDRQVFRLAQLALLLQVAGRNGTAVRTVDRLGLYDFFAANPFMIASVKDGKDDEDRLTLRLAGFTEQQLSYASAGQRFASRRRRLQYDMALLIAYQLTTIDGTGYVLTEMGLNMVDQLDSVYADAYRDSAAVVLRRLGKLSDRRLNEAAEKWLGQSWLLLDFLDDISETVPDNAAKQRAEERQ
jgi:hypothetical protein